MSNSTKGNLPKVSQNLPIAEVYVNPVVYIILRLGRMKSLLLSFWRAKQILLSVCWIRLKKWQVNNFLVSL